MVNSETFRDLADELAICDERAAAKLRDRAGVLIIDAFNSGQLSSLNGLRERIKYHCGPTPPLNGRHAVLAACASNLFSDVVGAEIKRCELRGGKLVLIETFYDGILPQRFPTLRRHHQIIGPRAKRLDRKRESQALRILARLVNRKRIPAARRSIPITMSKAAKLMGYVGDRSTIAERMHQQLVDNGSLFEKVNRQTFIFDVKDFPKRVRAQLLPKI